MKKYGFVYIWFDKKHKRYYVGCHWGKEDDGYICSSVWMRNSYKYRKDDFKRRILKRVYLREELFKTEDYYLNMIKEHEFGKRYYNLQKHWRHWSEKEQNRLSVSEKISIKTKEAMNTPEVREKYLEGLKTRNNKASDPEVIEKRRQGMINTMAQKFPIENRKKTKTNSKEECIELHRQNTKNMWERRTKEERKEIGKKISYSNKGKQNRLGQTNSTEHKCKQSIAIKEALSKIDRSGTSWWNNGTINTRNKVSPGPEWIKGKLSHNKSYNSETMKKIWANRKAGTLPMPDYT